MANLDPDRFEVVPIGITQEGGWVLGTNDPEQLRIKGRELPVVEHGETLVLARRPHRRVVC